MTPSEKYAAVGLKILERDGTTIMAAVTTKAGIVTAMANVVRQGVRLIIDGVHVDGEGLSLTRIRQLALVFGDVEDVTEIVIQGGTRTSGARPGSTPSAIRVKVTR